MKNSIYLLAICFLLSGCATTYHTYTDPNYLSSDEFMNYSSERTSQIIDLNERESNQIHENDTSSIYITNNYYENDFPRHSFYYSSRIRRFHHPYLQYRYHSNYYNNAYWGMYYPYSYGISTYYIDPWGDPYYNNYYSYYTPYYGFYSYYPYYSGYYNSYYQNYHSWGHTTNRDNRDNRERVFGHRSSFSNQNKNYIKTLNQDKIRNKNIKNYTERIKLNNKTDQEKNIKDSYSKTKNSYKSNTKNSYKSNTKNSYKSNTRNNYSPKNQNTYKSNNNDKSRSNRNNRSIKPRK